jgi:leucyl/phenylalanyl-tRNA--protein transferase
LDGLHVSRSLRAACRKFAVTVDQDFDAVIAGCADSRRPGGWIGRDFRHAYTILAAAGVAHSVEVRDRETGALVGGLYGVCINGLFSGESMFHRSRDASKVALVELVRLLTGDGSSRRLLDVQWTTPHLRSLGAVDLPRTEYLSRLAIALAEPPPAQFLAATRTR